MHYADDRRQGLELLLRAWDVCAGKSLPEKLLAFLRSSRAARRILGILFCSLGSYNSLINV